MLTIVRACSLKHSCSQLQLLPTSIPSQLFCSALVELCPLSFPFLLCFRCCQLKLLDAYRFYISDSKILLSHSLQNIAILSFLLAFLVKLGIEGLLRHSFSTFSLPFSLSLFFFIFLVFILFCFLFLDSGFFVCGFFGIHLFCFFFVFFCCCCCLIYFILFFYLFAVSRLPLSRRFHLLDWCLY